MGVPLAAPKPVGVGHITWDVLYTANAKVAQCVRTHKLSAKLMSRILIMEKMLLLNINAETLKSWMFDID